MARANFSRCEQACLCNVAQPRKASGDVGKSQSDMALDIFEEDGLRRDLVDDARDVGPQVSRVVVPSTPPGEGERLTGIAGSEDMNAAAPRSAVEGLEIVPYRCWSQGRVRHPRHESGRCMGFPLDVTNSAIGGFGDMDAEVEAGIAGAQGKAAQIAAAAIVGGGGTKSHKFNLRRLLYRRSRVGSSASIG